MYIQLCRLQAICPNSSILSLWHEGSHRQFVNKQEHSSNNVFTKRDSRLNLVDPALSHWIKRWQWKLGLRFKHRNVCLEQVHLSSYGDEFRASQIPKSRENGMESK